MIFSYKGKERLKKIRNEGSLRSESNQNRLTASTGKGLAQLFGQISSSYELINHLLTFGFDLYWRNQAARLALNFKGPLYLDLATGTGDMARSLARKLKGRGKILAIDFCWPMISELKKRKNFFPFISPLLAHAAHLPFKDNSIDLITLAFATRNLFSSSKNGLVYFREFYRILKPGGLYLNLETSQPDHPFLLRLFHFYVRTLVKPIGQIVSGNGPAYKYLSNSIISFLRAEQLRDLMIEAGFSQVEIIPLSGGIVAIHLAFK